MKIRAIRDLTSKNQNLTRKMMKKKKSKKRRKYR